MIQPTRRAVLIFAAGLPLALLVAGIAPSAWVVALDYSVLALLVILADAVLALPARHLTAGIACPERLFIGEAGALTATIDTAGYRRTLRLELLAEQQGDLDPPVIVAVAVLPNEPATASLKLVPRRRGRVSIERIWLRWQGPLSLVQCVHRIPVARTIDVLPNIRGVRDTAVQFLAREALFGNRIQLERGEGSEFDALKDHVPGMDTRSIDWTHSARHRKLISKEFRIERNHPIILAFDTGHLMLEPIDGMPRLDHAINAGLLLAWIALRGGDLVGSYGFDAAVRHYAAPVRGMTGLGHLQRATAELSYHHEETNFALGLAELAVRLRRRALVVLFTDFVDTTTAELLLESLQRISNRHVVLFVTLRDSVLQNIVDAPPDRFEDVTKSVVAHDMLRDREIVF